MTGPFKLLGHGFDTIQLSFQVELPTCLAEAIDSARSRARETRRPEPVHLGPGAVPGEVLRHGGGGGDAIFSTGELGELWFFKLVHHDGDAWRLTIKVRALALLTYGVEQAIDRMMERATGLGLKVIALTLGRIDYRFDFLTLRSWTPNENMVFRHSRAVVRPYEVFDRKHPVWDWNEDPELRRVLRGQRLETLMIGTIGGGLQVVIYDKRQECILKHNLVLLHGYDLDLTDSSWGLWRVEFRFANDVLKRRLKVRSLKDLRDNIRPMLFKAASTVKYLRAEDRDARPSQRELHPLWRDIHGAIPLITFNQPSLMPPERARSILDAERERSLNANIVGCALSLAATRTRDAGEAGRMASLLASSAVRIALRCDPEKADQAIARAWQARASN